MAGLSGLLYYQSHYCLVLFDKKVAFLEFIGGSEHVLDQVRAHYIQIIGVLMGDELLHAVNSSHVSIMVVALEPEDQILDVERPLR